MEGTSLRSSQEKILRSGNGIELLRRKFTAEVVAGSNRFIEEIKTYLSPLSPWRRLSLKL